MSAKCYLFDFDGTLVDSMPPWIESMKLILKRENIPIPDDLVKIITPLGNSGTAEYYINVLGVRKSKDKLIHDMSSLAYSAYRDTIPAKKTVSKTLFCLKEYGSSLNILTASPHKTLDVCLRRVGLWDYFDHIWSCNDFGTTKTDPMIYRMAAQRLDIPIHECIFVDDNINAVKTAKEAGMQVIGIYDESSEADAEHMRKLCGRYAYQFEDLLYL